jgi:hypothetical protein
MRSALNLTKIFDNTQLLSHITSQVQNFLSEKFFANERKHP